MRVRFVCARYLEDQPWRLRQVEVFRESYEGPYEGGRQLPMSCGAERGLSAAARADDASAQSALESVRCVFESLVVGVPAT